MTDNTIRLIDVPDAPQIPGLRFRHFAGESDYPHIFHVNVTSQQAEGIEAIHTLEGTVQFYSYLENCDLFEDMIFAEIDGEVVGYGRTMWWQDESGERPRIYLGFGRVVPEWRRKGLGTAIFRYLEAHLREIAAGHDYDGPRYFENGATEVDEGKHALLKHEGYQPVAYYASMIRPHLDDIPALELPDGLAVYPTTRKHFRAVWDADVEALEGHWGFPERTENDYLREIIEFPFLDESLWRIAWDGHPDEGGIVAGQVRSFINEPQNQTYNRRRGYTEFISVRKAYRRRGVAKTLLAMSLQALKERGMEEAALGVHTENPNGAFDLYQAMGFEVDRLDTTYRKPLVIGQ